MITGKLVFFFQNRHKFLRLFQAFPDFCRFSRKFHRFYQISAHIAQTVFLNELPDLIKLTLAFEIFRINHFVHFILYLTFPLIVKVFSG